MAADEPRVVDRGDDRRLHPADVGHHQVAPPCRVGQQSRAIVATAATGVATKTTSAAGILTHLVEHTEREGFGSPGGVSSRSGDVPAPGPQRQSERAADQAGADDQGPSPARRESCPAGCRRPPQPGRSSRSPWAPWR